MIGSQLLHRAESQSHRPIKIDDFWQKEFIPSLVDTGDEDVTFYSRIINKSGVYIRVV